MYAGQWIEAESPADESFIRIRDIDSGNSVIVHLEKPISRKGVERAEILRAFAIGVWLTHPHLSKIEQ